MHMTITSHMRRREDKTFPNLVTGNIDAAVIRSAAGIHNPIISAARISFCREPSLNVLDLHIPSHRRRIDETIFQQESNSPARS